MPLRKVNIFSEVGNDDLDALMETENKSYRGLCSVSLSEMDTTVQPLIKAGSVIEVNGALFNADSDESISGTPADGTIYIKLIPAGDPVTVTAQFTATAPVWDNEKQGWYSPTTGEENYRYLPIKMTKSGTSYTNKLIVFIPRVIGAGILSNTGAVDFSGNVIFRGSASFGAGSIAGFLDDGTPFYRKIIPVTILAGFITQVAAHGISNAYTNNKIIGVFVYVQGTITMESKFWFTNFDNSASAANSLKYCSWDDTNIIPCRYGTSGNLTFYVVIDYK